MSLEKQEIFDTFVPAGKLIFYTPAPHSGKDDNPAHCQRFLLVDSIEHAGLAFARHLLRQTDVEIVHLHAAHRGIIGGKLPRCRYQALGYGSDLSATIEHVLTDIQPSVIVHFRSFCIDAIDTALSRYVYRSAIEDHAICVIEVTTTVQNNVVDKINLEDANARHALALLFSWTSHLPPKSKKPSRGQILKTLNSNDDENSKLLYEKAINTLISKKQQIKHKRHSSNLAHPPSTVTENPSDPAQVESISPKVAGPLLRRSEESNARPANGIKHRFPWGYTTFNTAYDDGSLCETKA